MTQPAQQTPPFFEEEAAAPATRAQRAANLALRLCSLAAKLALTLFMGKYFELSAIGAYGLVFGAVMMANTFLGQELGHVAMREIVSVQRSEALQKIRDQAIWHILNYMAFGLFLLLLATVNAMDISWHFYAFIFSLSVTENLGTLLHYSMNARHQQLSANAMLFVRAAAWVPVVIGLCLYDPAFRNEETVLTAWATGSALALLFPLWVWRGWGWRRALKAKINWSWIIKCVRKSTLIWIGLMGTIAGGYLDRYVVGHYLDLDHVGVMTFFYSFINACYPLLESGLLAFATTNLIALYNKKDQTGFAAEARRMFVQTNIGTVFLVTGLALFVPILAYLLGREAFLAETKTLWLLLAAMLLNGPSLAAATILFARHQDHALWLGNVLFVLPVLIGNFTLVPWLGFSGIGYSAILSALFLLLWRLGAVRHGDRHHGGARA